MSAFDDLDSCNLRSCKVDGNACRVMNSSELYIMQIEASVYAGSAC